MPRPKFQPDPIPVNLSDVYPFDFGKRTEDLALWAALQAKAGEGAVCEVCVGDGRASGSLVEDRYGIDIDPAFVRRARGLGITATVGDAARRESWSGIPADCALVFCAYSSLFLLRHDQQVAMLRLMVEHVRSGGIVAIETFTPALSGHAEMDAPVQNPNTPLDDRWTRRTTYEVEQLPDDQQGGAGRGKTRVRRLYGPEPLDWRMELEETIYWRTPSNLAGTLASACSGVVRQETGGRVPVGSVLTTWTRENP